MRQVVVLCLLVRALSKISCNCEATRSGAIPPPPRKHPSPGSSCVGTPPNSPPRRTIAPQERRGGVGWGVRASGRLRRSERPRMRQDAPALLAGLEGCGTQMHIFKRLSREPKKEICQALRYILLRKKRARSTGRIGGCVCIGCIRGSGLQVGEICILCAKFACSSNAKAGNFAQSANSLLRRLKIILAEASGCVSEASGRIGQVKMPK